jgi:protoporphyrinogen oxidase
MAQGIMDGGGRIEYGSQVTGIAVAKGRFDVVTVQTPEGTIRFKPQHVIASIPIELLVSLVPGAQAPASSTQKRTKHTVLFVYLFLDHPPKFPHPYLQVTCPQTRIGRITNYSAYSPEMVPEGQTCLCCEVYCFGEDRLLALNDEQIARQVLQDCGVSHLVDPEKCFDRLVLRLPGADPSQNKDNWINQDRLQMMAQLEPYQNVYYTNRTELDIATLAGIEAAEAILAGNRSDFDRRIDPRLLGVRSESKAFAFA